MRLICPNCGAQYEVDADVIPTAGRDVQCSNCGHTWYQRPSDRSEAEAEAEAVAEPETPVTDDASPEPEAAEADATPEVAEVETPTEPEPEAEPQEDAAEPAEEPEDQVAEAPAARELDEEVASVLREEAGLETQARARESETLETQTDLGLDSTATPDADTDAKEKTQHLRGIDDDLGASVAAAAVSSGQRKDLLPDIEEINSTLTASTEEAEEGSEHAKQEKARRGGFRRGFVLTVAFFALMLVVYLNAQRIADAVPSMTPALSAYVEWVNNMRLAIDGILRGAVDRLTALTSQMGG